MTADATAITLTTAEAAARLGVHPATVRVWATDGVRVGGLTLRLVAIPAGSRQYRFAPAAIDDFLTELRAARDLPQTTGIGPRPETQTEYDRRAASDFAEMKAALGRN